jgi:hypothetical protein
MRELNIIFNVQGSISQTIAIGDHWRTLTDTEIIDALNGCGELVAGTSSVVGDELTVIDRHETLLIGKIISSELDAEFTDFEVDSV